MTGSILFLTLISFSVGYAVVFAAGPIAQSHGTLRTQELICILLLGLVATLFGLIRKPVAYGGKLIVLLPVYALFQILPLPLWLLRILSPARAELTVALESIGISERWAPISVAPAATLLHALLLMACVIVFVITCSLARDFAVRPWIVMAPMIVMGAAESIIGLLQVASDPQSVATGTFLIRNHYAGFLEMVLPFAALLPFAGRRSAWLAVLGTGLTVLLFSGIVSSLSRMGFIASITSLGVVAFLGLSQGRSVPGILLLGTFIACLGLAMFFLLPSPRLVVRFGEIENTKDARSPVDETLHLIKAYPIFGCGLGAYESAFLKYKTSNAALNQDYAHNDYLQYLAELGLAGFALVLVPMVVVLAKLIRGRGSSAEVAWLRLACAGSIFAIAMHSFVDFNLYVPANLLTLAWVLGVSASIVAPAKSV